MMGTIKMMIKLMKSTDEKRFAVINAAEGVAVTPNVPYIDDGNPLHTLTVYRAEDAVGPQPVMVEVHGGSWVYGDSQLNRYSNHWVAKRGFTVFSLGYRICPEVNYAGGLEDIFQAFQWVYEHGAEYGGDMNNVYLCGDSSGGHLSSLAVECMADADKAEAFGGLKTDLRFNAVNFSCGAFYLRDMCEIPCARAYFGKIIGKGWKKSKYYDLANFDLKPGLEVPPMLFSSCYKDFLRKYVLKAYEAVKAAGYTCKLIYRDAKTENELEHVYNVHWPDWPESEETNQGMLDWFLQYKK
ncbi:MAG: alpha/beta hydrolase [Clostridia bacterium]|nr:alpha/beta hydrolase [Clostridia bacterium]